MKKHTDSGLASGLVNSNSAICKAGSRCNPGGH
jgi:hypothetical protein